MKKTVFLVFIFSIITILIVASGCGKDGHDGNAYISINWIYNPLYYSDNNDATPPYFYNGSYCKSNPGAYSFSYTAWDGSVWIGTYTISINPGGKGSFLLQDGKDGEDKYFRLWCLSSGPTIYAAKAIQEITAGNKYELIQADGSSAISKSSAFKRVSTVENTSNPISIDENSIVEEEIQGGYTLKVESHRVK